MRATNRFQIVIPATTIACLCFAGCAITLESAAPPRPLPGPPDRPLTRAEVADLSTRVALDHGYRDIRIEEMERDDHDRWEIEIAGWIGGRRGELHLVIDGRSGRVLRVEEDHERRRHRDRDDEDEDEADD